MTTTTIIWFRSDLRLDDNPAVAAALRSGGFVVPVYIWSPQSDGARELGSASRWWLQRSLAALADELHGRGAKLIMRAADDPAAELHSLAREAGAGAIYFNREYEPYALARDERIKTQFKNINVEIKSFNANLLIEPWELANSTGGPFKVFTPFWKRVVDRLKTSGVALADFAGTICGANTNIESTPLEQLGIEHQADAHGSWHRYWQPGAMAAQQRLLDFVSNNISNYPLAHDRFDCDGTSVLSPHLRFGEIGPRQIWVAANKSIQKAARGKQAEASVAFLRQIIWREFAYHLLYHFPSSVSQPLQSKFAAFPWQYDESALQSWKDGQTGYPVVDAGMRQLRETGWIHNRVRMIVASFLVKDLLIPWQQGEQWFWDTLVDADLANNILGWQWVAGCGADAAPFFRVFNPVTQGTKFDPQGNYVRQWLPELASLRDKSAHTPWSADAKLDYPKRIIEHDLARRRALDAFSQV